MIDRLGQLIWASFASPGRIAGAIVGLDLPRAVLWQAMGLVTVLNVLILAATQAILPVPPAESVIEVSPMAYALISGAMAVMLVFALFYSGAALGGRGRFADAIALVVWFVVLVIVLRTAVAFSILVSPIIQEILALASTGVMGWVLVNFINVLHGFHNLGKALLVLIFAVIGIMFGLVSILTLIGVGANGGTA
jgi:hypothetical protein